MREKPLILVVDDEGDFLEIMKAKLTAAGFDVALAHDGEEGIAMATTLRPDLTLMDVSMPGKKDGTDAAVAIKQNPASRDLQVVFLTSLRELWMTMPIEKRNLIESLDITTLLQKTNDFNLF